MLLLNVGSSESFVFGDNISIYRDFDIYDFTNYLQSNIFVTYYMKCNILKSIKGAHYA